MARSTGAFKNKIFIRKTINGVFLGLIGFIVFAGGAYVNELRGQETADAGFSGLTVVENNSMTASAIMAEDEWEEEADADDDASLMLQ